MVRKKTTPQHADVLDAATTGDLAFLAENEDRLRAAVDAHGCTALHWAAGSGHVDCVEYLITQSLDPSQKQTTNGRTPLHYAARNGRTEVCRLLIEDYGVEADALADADVTPFQLACWQVQESVMQYLASRHDVDCGRVNDFGCSALHWIALAPRTVEENAHLRCCAWLEEVIDGDWSLTNSQGHEPLHKAAFSGHLHMVEWLVEVKKRREVPDGHGNYAADLAREGGHDNVAQYLATTAAPDREKLAAHLAKLSGTRVDASDAASLTKAFRQAALRHHPDKAGDACVFDDCVQTYRRLVDGVPGNPLRDPDRIGSLLGSSSSKFARFEAKLLVVLLEQPSGLALGSLKKRYQRAFPNDCEDFPDPKAHGYRKLAHLLRSECPNSCRVDDNCVLHAARAKGDVERLLLLDGGDPSPPPPPVDGAIVCSGSVRNV